MKFSKNIESTNNETDNGDSKHNQKYKKARFEVMKNDGSCVNEQRIDENTTVTTEREYNITPVTSKNDIVDHIHNRKVETTKGKSKPRVLQCLLPIAILFAFQVIVYVNGQIFTSKTS